MVVHADQRRNVVSGRVVTVKNKLIVCDPPPVGLVVPVYCGTVVLFINAPK
jgi:hypothetical protein